MFHAMGREMDGMAASEQTGDVATTVNVGHQAKSLQKEAVRVAAQLNKAAPHISRQKMDTLRTVSLMLAEIISAQQPELALERFHDRRADIEQGLIHLAG